MKHEVSSSLMEIHALHDLYLVSEKWVNSGHMHMQCFKPFKGTQREIGKCDIESWKERQDDTLGDVSSEA